MSIRDLIIGGSRFAPPTDDFWNFEAEGVKRWRKSRRNAVTEIIVHESVTRSREDTIKVLDRKGLGVHFMIDDDGCITQHADPLSDWMMHAGAPHNKVSVGVEIVNPYYPRNLREGFLWDRVIDAPWAHEGRYVLPTRAQLEATTALLRSLTIKGALSVSRLWAGLDIGRKTMAMGRVKGCEKVGTGIYAHQYFAHADGSFPVLYAWLRLHAMLPPDDAYATSIELAEGAKGAVDVAKYLGNMNRTEVYNGS